MTGTRTVVAVTTASILALAGIASAETYKLKGRSVWIPEKVSSSKLADGRTVTRQVLKGTAIADNQATPLSFVSQDCMFTTVTAADGKTFKSGGFCDGVDKDGDVYWAVGNADESGGKWHYIGGTGKFQGLEGVGPISWHSSGRMARSWPPGRAPAP